MNRAVEEFVDRAAEPQVEPLVQADALIEGEVELAQNRPRQRIAAHIAEHARLGNGERRWIEVPALIVAGNERIEAGNYIPVPPFW